MAIIWWILLECLNCYVVFLFFKRMKIIQQSKNVENITEQSIFQVFSVKEIYNPTKVRSNL